MISFGETDCHWDCKSRLTHRRSGTNQCYDSFGEIAFYKIIANHTILYEIEPGISRVFSRFQMLLARFKLINNSLPALISEYFGYATTRHRLWYWRAKRMVCILPLCSGHSAKTTVFETQPVICCVQQALWDWLSCRKVAQTGLILHFPKSAVGAVRFLSDV